MKLKIITPILLALSLVLPIAQISAATEAKKEEGRLARIVKSTAFKVGIAAGVGGTILVMMLAPLVKKGAEKAEKSLTDYRIKQERVAEDKRRKEIEDLYPGLVEKSEKTRLLILSLHHTWQSSPERKDGMSRENYIAHRIVEGPYYQEGYDLMQRHYCIHQPTRVEEWINHYPKRYGAPVSTTPPDRPTELAAPNEGPNRKERFKKDLAEYLKTGIKTV